MSDSMIVAIISSIVIILQGIYLLKKIDNLRYSIKTDIKNRLDTLEDNDEN